VKPGYRPPEDVEIYKNRTAHAWKNRGNGGIVGAEPVEEKSPLQAAAAAAKNAKRREARKKAAAASGDGKSGYDDGTVNGTTEEQKKEVIVVDPEAERLKEARKLSKKLRQARELSEKKDKGEGLLPEQFQKVIKIQELIRQLDNLGFDADGEKKATETDSG
jgi:partner of Y14 and mago protein